MGLYDSVRLIPGIGVPDMIGGVITGTVKENYNKDFPGKVKVELFLGEEGKNVTGWIPVMTQYGGKEYGNYFLPEVDAEVVVAFHMGDRNRPIVIGCLWSEKNPYPQETVKEENPLKVIMTKGGSVITFDDTKDKELISVKTKKGSFFEISEENQTITLSDKDKKNSVIINAKDGDVTVSADKTFNLKVGGKAAIAVTDKEITLKSTTIATDAQKDLNLKGQNANVEGTSVKVKGSGSLEVSASGTTQIKGAMVKIN